MTVFVSHKVSKENDVGSSSRCAAQFKELVEKYAPGTKVYLSSDWESIPAGSVFFQELDDALSKCDAFFALIVKNDNAKELWVNYEAGFVRGRRLKPKIILFKDVSPEHCAFPLIGLQLMPCGDTNRWMIELGKIGVKFDKANKVRDRFADLFEKRLPVESI